MAAAEFRTDVWTGRQVIVAAARAHRPQTISSVAEISNRLQQDSEEAKSDPFLEGRETNTPSERVALRRDTTAFDQAGWLVRIVANRYPAVAQLSDTAENAATGIHDVVIECPDFRRCWLQFSTSEVARVFTAWQLRQQQLLSVDGVKSIQIFRNQGSAAGASLGHSHSQIISLNTIPALTKQRSQNADGFYRWRTSEIQIGSRVVRAEHLLLVCPDASWVSGQLRICPPNDESASSVPFHQLSSEATWKLAETVKNAIAAVKELFPEASFNLVLNQPPASQIDAFPWSIDIMPRTSSFAGFELSCDIPIITTSPEFAAAEYSKYFSEVPNATLSEAAICPPNYSWRSP